MKSLSAKLSKPAAKTIAAFMVVWLSGFLFLLCCGTMQAQASEKDFCPLSGKGQSHCDRMKKDSGLPVFNKNSGNTEIDCCGFLPAVFDKTRKIEKQEQAAKPADKIKLDLPVFSIPENDFQIAADYNSPVLKPQKIFIKNCIFRI